MQKKRGRPRKQRAPVHKHVDTPEVIEPVAATPPEDLASSGIVGASQYNPGDHTIAKWTQGTGETSLIEVTVIAVIPGSSPTQYQVQTEMGVTMILPETDLGQ